MNYSDYFLDPSLSNIDRLNSLVLSLEETLIKHSKSFGSILRLGGNENYGEYLKNRSLPEEGVPWNGFSEEFISMFDQSVIWQSPSTMLNITPPPNMASLACSFLASLFNPNFGTDESSGMLMASELIVIRYLAELVGWDPEYAGGVGTFGGKGTNLYGLKCGIKSAIPDADVNGIRSDELVVFTNTKAHPCHREISAWMGIGIKNVKVLPVTKDGVLDLELFKTELYESLRLGKKVACIYLNAGTTNEGYIDPIHDVAQIRDEAVKEFGLDYVPHIHADSVIGWIWLFFKGYDFESNPLKLSTEEERKIKNELRKISQIKEADSFGADLHKMAFCPYVSSFFIAKNVKDLGHQGAFSVSEAEDLRHGEYAPFEFSLELSRYSMGAVSAYATFELFGKNGFREMILHLVRMNQMIRERITERPDFTVVLPDAPGFATLFIAIPDGYASVGIDAFSDDERNIIAEYNRHFYLYLQDRIKGESADTHIAISKSYKPFGADTPLSPLKLYPTCVNARTEDIIKAVSSLLDLKKDFDAQKFVPVDTLRRPADLSIRE